MRTIQTAAHPRGPLGATITIDRIPWVPKPNTSGRRTSYQAINVAEVHIDENRVRNWPMVYILTNTEEAYVGQTTSVLSRMDQHGANPAKHDFTHTNLIYSDAFNMSVITDYEHRLIQLMNADGLYRLTNKNEGLQDSDYYCKDEYDEMFQQLWKELADYNLVQHTIEQLEESEVFKYSPYKRLNTEQEAAFSDIFGAVTSYIDGGKPAPIVVEGMPGTGKTVLAVFLLKALRDSEKFRHLNVKILEPMTALKATLQDSLKGVYGLSEDDIIGPSDLASAKAGFVPGEKGRYDILLVDESHKLKGRRNIQNYADFDRSSTALGLDKMTCTQVDWVLNQAKLPIFFYDPLQSIGRSGVTPEEFKSSIGNAANEPIRLESQMRVKGGKGYLEYIQAILHNGNPESKTFPEYELEMHQDFVSFYDSFQQTLSANGLTRMVAGFSWEWLTNPKRKLRAGETPAEYDISIEGFNLRWNRKNANWVGIGTKDPTAAQEVGCIHSIQGYDLSYAYVIFGNELGYDRKTQTLKVNRNAYKDKNGKNATEDADLLTYIENVYYVLLTRGINGTHVYVCDPDLREHLSRFFPQSH